MGPQQGKGAATLDFAIVFILTGLVRELKFVQENKFLSQFAMFSPKLLPVPNLLDGPLLSVNRRFLEILANARHSSGQSCRDAGCHSLAGFRGTWG